MGQAAHRAAAAAAEAASQQAAADGARWETMGALGRMMSERAEHEAAGRRAEELEAAKQRLKLASVARGAEATKSLDQAFSV